MTTVNARIKYAIAADQYEREMEKLFRANDLKLIQPAFLPTATLLFWDDVMLRMLATGWRHIVR